MVRNWNAFGRQSVQFPVSTNNFFPSVFSLIIKENTRLEFQLHLLQTFLSVILCVCVATSRSLTMGIPQIDLRFLIMLREDYNARCSTLCNFIHALVVLSLLLSPKYLSKYGTLFFTILNLCYFLKVRDQVSKQDNITGNILVLCVLTINIWKVGVRARAAPWRKWLDAWLPPRRTVVPRSRLGHSIGVFMVDETGSGQVLLGVPPVFLCNKFHSTIYPHLPHLFHLLL